MSSSIPASARSRNIFARAALPHLRTELAHGDEVRIDFASDADYSRPGETTQYYFVARDSVTVTLIRMRAAFDGPGCKFETVVVPWSSIRSLTLADAYRDAGAVAETSL
jgi:hypothetical protein